MQPTKTVYFPDRLPVSDASIPQSVLYELKKQGIVAPDTRKIHFCGVLSFSGVTAVFLPRNYSGNDEEEGLAAHHLLRALHKFYRDKETGVFAAESESEIIGGTSLSLAAALIDDYIANGLYVRRTRINTTTSGKISWPKTVARSTAYIGPSGPLYIDLATTHSRYIANCETAKIHASVMRELYPIFGKIWTGESRMPSQRLEGIPRPNGNITSQIAHLRREMQLSYSERDIFLIRSLILYLKNELGTRAGVFLIGVRKFHSLWEAMLDECLDGRYPVNNRLPIPVYLTGRDEFIPVARKGQRTDTVLYDTQRKQIAIVDAKYYDASTANSAPGWPDLVKQFFYQKAIHHLELDDIPISNHFIFPGTENLLKTAFVAKRDVPVTSMNDSLPDFSPVHCHYQDPLELLRMYATGRKLMKLTSEIFSVGSHAAISSVKVDNS